ncbi:MAG: flavodoxin family protein [Methanomicrobium sp.]|nr:flavodoxin family protein [Methanomicrobium sp.]
MKVIGINASPRKKWNTAKLLKNALMGCESQGAETELIHLYDLDFKGCTSCFACKLKDGKNYGRCSVKDSLAPVLDKIREADAIILGSPIYFGCVTGEMRSFMERLMFPYLVYANPPASLYPKKIKTAFIYTMNVSEEQMREFYSFHTGANEDFLKRTFGDCESLFCNETLQFEDYSKVVFSYCNPEDRIKRHETIFPKDCERAFELGKRLLQ